MDNDKRISVPSFETNVLYMMALAMDLILRDCERRMAAGRAGWKHEKKSVFTRFMKAVKDACLLNEMLTQDIYDVDEKHSFKNIPVWQEEANELARLVLLYADKSSDVDAVEKIHSYIRSFKGDGIADDELLERFYLNKGH